MRQRPIPAPRLISRARLNRLLPIVALFYSFLLFPPEMSLTLFGFWLPTYRIALIVGTIVVLMRMVRERNRGLNLPDICISVASFWILISFVVVYGIAQGTTRGAGVLLDVVGSYMIARSSVRSFDDFRYFLLLCLPGLTLAAGIMTIESLSGRLLYRPAFASVFGNVSSYSGGKSSGQIVILPETRMGLLRAYGPFSHPILGGLILGVFMPLYYFSGIRAWPWWAGVFSALAGLFSLSSAAILGTVIAIAGISLDFAKRRMLPQLSWWSIIFLVGMALWAVHLVSKSGIVAVLARFTLVPHTATYRILIWEYGSKSVAEHPWFGIGYQQWVRLGWMGESIDAHFLMLAVRHGLTVPMLILGAAIFAMARLGLLTRNLAPNDRKMVIGVIISMTILLIAGQTVAFFGASHLVFMAMLGFTTSLMSYASQTSRRPKTVGQRSRLVVGGPVRLNEPGAS